MKILCIIVLYKSSLYDAISYKECVNYYLNDNSIGIFVYDNSPSPMHSVGELKTKGIVYIHDSNNSGVSTGYNAGAEYAKTNHYEWLLLLDQDTHFPQNFINSIKNAYSKDSSLNLIVPNVVYNAGIPFSPVKRCMFRNKAVFLKEGVYTLKDYMPVNSGACVKLDSFNIIGGYNPHIRLDFADYDFFSRLCEVDSNFYIMNVTASQSFSNEEKDEEKLKYRFILYVESGKEAMNNKLIGRSSLFRMVRHALALTIRTKNPFFVMYLIKNI